MVDFKAIHECAMEHAKTYLRSEVELLDPIQQVDAHKVFRQLGYASLFAYCVDALKLSESDSYALITVARKARVVPELKQAVAAGRLTVSQAKRIASVISDENKEEWIEKAATLKQRELEREVARVNPKGMVRDRFKPIAADLVELSGGISYETEKLLKRVLDLESQRRKKAATLDDALRAMAELYIEKNDPVKKAERNIGKPVAQLSSRRASAQEHHQVNHRDKGRCTFVDQNGRRCPNERWVEKHHIIGKARGGSNKLGNLTTLCSGHHKTVHAMQSTRGGVGASARR